MTGSGHTIEFHVVPPERGALWGRESPGEGGSWMVATMSTFGDIVWGMIVFFFWFMAIWIFITIFADIFRRRDLSGWGKAGWILLIFIVPFLGALIYLIARPKMTAQDKEDMEKMQEAQRRMSGYSAADEIAKLSKLRDEGKITAEEYEEMKRKALISV
jgi:phospholipase D-like protein/putative oligomerization/nucleic acid binding protein